MTHSGKIMLVCGIAALLSYAAIPLSSYANSTTMIQDDITIGIGVKSMVGLSVISHEVGADSGVVYSDGVYSKTMENGERISEFGKTTLRIICNTASPKASDATCRRDGFALKVAPAEGSYITKNNTRYAAMLANSGQSSIISASSDINGTDSTWVMKVSTSNGLPIETTDDDGIVHTTTSSNPSVTDAAITLGFEEDHIIPGTSTKIAYGNPFQTYGGELHYVSDLTATITYGVGISGYQAAGTYTGTLVYTVEIGASS